MTEYVEATCHSILAQISVASSCSSPSLTCTGLAVVSAPSCTFSGPYMCCTKIYQIHEKSYLRPVQPTILRQAGPIRMRQPPSPRVCCSTSLSHSCDTAGRDSSDCGCHMRAVSYKAPEEASNRCNCVVHHSFSASHDRIGELPDRPSIAICCRLAAKAHCRRGAPRLCLQFALVARLDREVGF